MANLAAAAEALVAFHTDQITAYTPDEGMRAVFAGPCDYEKAKEGFRGVLIAAIRNENDGSKVASTFARELGAVSKAQHSGKVFVYLNAFADAVAGIVHGVTAAYDPAESLQKVAVSARDNVINFRHCVFSGLSLLAYYMEDINSLDSAAKFLAVRMPTLDTSAALLRGAALHRQVALDAKDKLARHGLARIDPDVQTVLVAMLGEPKLPPRPARDHRRSARVKVQPSA